MSDGGRRRGAAPTSRTPSCPEYWDDFYSEGGPGCVDTYEWYLLYADIRPFLLNHLREHQRVLHIGCGNSLVGERMVTDGGLPEVTVLNIDNCEMIIEKMRQRPAAERASSSGKKGAQHASRSRDRGGGGQDAANGGQDEEVRCAYRCMSVERLDLEDSSFDVGLDKGCLDALLSTGRDEDGLNETIQKMMCEMYRVLKPGAKFLIFSKNDNFITNPYFYLDDAIEWEVQADTFDRTGLAASRNSAAGDCGPGGSALARTFYLYTLTSCKMTEAP